MKKHLLRLRIWMDAHKGAWYWCLDYPDGKKTMMLSYREAKGLRDVFGGRLYIDFKQVEERLIDLYR